MEKGSTLHVIVTTLNFAIGSWNYYLIIATARKFKTSDKYLQENRNEGSKMKTYMKYAYD